MDWAFAICSFFTLWFVLALVAGIGTGAQFSLTFAGYSYTGPIYGCLPAMLIGLMAVGGSAFYLVVSFQEGRSVAHHDSLTRDIGSRSASVKQSHLVQDRQAEQASDGDA